MAPKPTPKAGQLPSAKAQPVEPALRLASDQLACLADLVAERLRDAVPPGLVDAQTLARRLGISRSTVYEHSAELGAIEVGDGDRPRLRFDYDRAVEAWTRRSADRRPQQPEARSSARITRRRRPSRLDSGTQLLPIAGRSTPIGGR
jgi:hypothetical protein